MSIKRVYRQFFSLVIVAAMTLATTSSLIAQNAIGFAIGLKDTPEEAPAIAIEHLEYTLDQVLNHQKILNRTGACSLLISLIEVDRTIIETRPPRTNLQFDLIVDAVDSKGQIFHTTTLKSVGMGETDSLAYVASVKMVNFRNKYFYAFLEECRAKMSKFR